MRYVCRGEARHRGLLISALRTAGMSEAAPRRGSGEASERMEAIISAFCCHTASLNFRATIRSVSQLAAPKRLKVSGSSGSNGFLIGLIWI